MILLHVIEARRPSFSKDMCGIWMHPQSSHPRKTIHHLCTSREGLVQVSKELCVIYSDLMSIFLTSHRTQWAAGVALLENHCVQEKSQLPCIYLYSSFWHWECMKIPRTGQKPTVLPSIPKFWWHGWQRVEVGIVTRDQSWFLTSLYQII